MRHFDDGKMEVAGALEQQPSAAKEVLPIDCREVLVLMTS
jgi:hypothetical protein